MRRYRKWVLTLGILAVTPGLQAAGPFSFGQPQNNASPNAAAAQAPKSKNQRVAENVALALRKANFHGYEIDIEFKDGTAVLRGKVSDPQQKVRASEIVSGVTDVRKVDNKLVVLSQSRGAIRQVSATDADLAAAAAPAASAATNQEKAMQIGRALQSAGLIGYDIEVLYQNGQALLRGTVATPDQRAAAARIAGTVPGVQAVSNQLRIDSQASQAAQPPASPYAMTAYQPVPGASPQTGPSYTPGQPMVPPTGPMGPGQMGPGQMGPGPMGAPMPATGPGPNGAVFNNPSVPDYAWPSYAQYPNYAAVTYPSQYSASAWPYIGPFYPYPQVPLNWRKVSLEWDDGHWDLKFNPRTERWWWFFDPRNW